jgi:hypothetical protein
VKKKEKVYIAYDINVETLLLNDFQKLLFKHIINFLLFYILMGNIILLICFEMIEQQSSVKNYLGFMNYLRVHCILHY